MRGSGTSRPSGLNVQPYLKAPQEAVGASAEATDFSFRDNPSRPDGHSAPHAGTSHGTDLLHNQTSPNNDHSLGTARHWRCSQRPLVSSALHVSASSTFDNLPSLHPQNLFTGQSQNKWIAGSSKATLSLSWPKAALLKQLDVVFSGATVSGQAGGDCFQKDSKGGPAASPERKRQFRPPSTSNLWSPVNFKSRSQSPDPRPVRLVGGLSPTPSRSGTTEVSRALRRVRSITQPKNHLCRDSAGPDHPSRSTDTPMRHSSGARTVRSTTCSR